MIWNKQKIKIDLTYLKIDRSLMKGALQLGYICSRREVLAEKLRGCGLQVSWNPYPISDQNLWCSLLYLRPDPKFDILFQTEPFNQYPFPNLSYNQFPKSDQS